MKKPWFLTVMIFLLVPWLLVGCGISQELYDTVMTERDSFMAQLQSVQSELDAAKSKLQSIQSELKDKDIELESMADELGTAKSETEAAESDLVDKESELHTTQSELEAVKAKLEEALLKLIEAEAPEVEPPKVTGQTYQNTKYGFSCDYPDGWSVDEGVDYAVLFAGAVEGEYDYLTSISVIVQESLVKQPLEDIVSLTNLATKSQFPSFTVVQEYETTIGGEPAIVQVWTFDSADMMGYPIKSATATFIRDKTIFMIILDVTEDVYEQNRDEFVLVTETFKFQ